VQKDIQQRYSNTFARSNVLGTDEAAAKIGDGRIYNAQNVTRHENKWQSNVFGDPIVERSGRKNLATGDKGREGLFGNNEPVDAYKRKQNFAAALSQKVEMQGPAYNEEPAEQRRLKELYGNSQYAPLGR
jgi:hypothetical protein